MEIVFFPFQLSERGEFSLVQSTCNKPSLDCTLHRDSDETESSVYFLMHFLKKNIMECTVLELILWSKYKRK